ncbi:AraC family transcriptional regulator [Spongiibacter taiwanensis]|uniref:helix-turn-helix domain-containing protein n=1 Tax=Spongiibacter taiwanensis TaxID=1748242 RepID=UPI0020356420|nr:AraC family transcriptional regulator [Spongiibacter taiwanensis]USA42315.1 AraC family transcriptional regulator [Spongiibacter taiwanensis]
MNLVRSGALTGFQALVAGFGANPIQLIRASGLSEVQFRNPDTYISYSKMALLLENAAIACDQPLLGLILAGQNRPGVLGDLPATVSSEPSVDLALAELSRHIYLVARGVHLTQSPQGNLVRIQMRFDVGSPKGVNQLLQLSVGHLANIVAGLAGADRFSLNLQLRQPPPSHPDAAGCRFYRCCVFNSDFDGVLVDPAWLKKRPLLDQASIQHHLHERLRDLQAQHPNSLPSQVRAIIAQLLSSGECSVEAIAANLDLHPRMLQLKLKAEGTHYQMLLKETRQAIAEESLMRSDVPITDLALNLGFADIAVFSRSFKSWTGMSPRQWRQKAKV